MSESLPSRQAIGLTRVVMFWKLIEYAGLVLFTIVVPRQMGPEGYGRFAVLYALISLLILIIGFGAHPTFGRFLPEFLTKGETWKIEVLFTQMFWIRALIAMVFTGAFLVILPRLLPSASRFTVLMGAAAFAAAGVGATCYKFFFGMNALGKWLTYESLPRFLLVALLLLLGGIHDLDRAGVALFVTQATFLFLGLYWTRSYFTRNEAIYSWETFSWPFRFGVLLYAANLPLLAIWRGGEVVLAYYGVPSTEVAYFSVANTVAFAFAALVGHFTLTTLPSVTAHHVAGNQAQVDGWLGFMLKYLTIAAILFLFSVHAGGAWVVEKLLGARYLPVVPNLELLALGLLPIALVRTGITVATVLKTPRSVLWIAMGALGAFALGAVVLVPRYGAHGVSVALASAVVCAAVITCFQFHLGSVLAVARFWRLLLLGILAYGVMVLPFSSAVWEDLLATALFVVSLFVARVVSARELREVVLGFVGAPARTESS